MNANQLAHPQNYLINVCVAGDAFPVSFVDLQLVESSSAIQRPRYFAETEADKAFINSLEAFLRWGRSYEINNGYSFVPDRDPSRNVAGLVPIHDYTRYFANRQIPIAANGSLYGHDIVHASRYKKAFDNTLFADVVAYAATNSLGDEKRENRFARAIDRFGDTTISLSFSDLPGFKRWKDLKFDVSNARTHLYELVRLLTGDDSIDLSRGLGVETGEPREIDIIVNNLWYQLGLDYYEQRAGMASLTWHKNELFTLGTSRDRDPGISAAAGSLLLSEAVRT